MCQGGYCRMCEGCILEIDSKANTIPRRFIIRGMKIGETESGTLRPAIASISSKWLTGYL